MKETYLPCARADRLVVKELADEVLVYDLQRDKAHCLNLTAAAVWKECDGRSTANEIARRLLAEPGGRATGLPAAHSRSLQLKGSEPEAAEVVWLALEQLNRSHLLTEQVSWPTALPRMSRREAIRQVGLGAAIALPIVATVVAPTAVQAGSCGGAGAPCGTGSQCCSGTCTGPGGSCVGGPLNRQERSRQR